jgi:hypothetical protein
MTYRSMADLTAENMVLRDRMILVKTYSKTAGMAIARRNDWMKDARRTDDPVIRSTCVRFARRLNRLAVQDLMQVRKAMTP